jgi:hypothetical protein
LKDIVEMPEGKKLGLKVVGGSKIWTYKKAYYRSHQYVDDGNTLSLCKKGKILSIYYYGKENY